MWCPSLWSIPLKSSAHKTESFPDNESSKKHYDFWVGRNIILSQIVTRVEWLTIKPLKAFLSLIRNRPSKEVILICLISGSNLLFKKEERQRTMWGWRYQGLLWIRLIVWMIFHSVGRSGRCTGWWLTWCWWRTLRRPFVGRERSRRNERSAGF